MSESKSVEPPPLPGAEKILTMLRDASPQEWLDRIASIVQLGEVELAMYLLNEYRARF